MAREQNDGIFEFLMGMTLGIIGGGLVGILLAPKPGHELREEAQAYLKELPGKVKTDIQDPEGKTRSFFSKTILNLENQVGRVNRAIRAGKMAEAKKREELDSGYSYNEAVR
jgi:gas vesicle protein